MARSMTGYGHASFADGELSVDVVVRCVNGKHLKTKVCLDVPMPVLEEEIAGLVSRQMSRGTVDVSVRLDWSGAAAGAFNSRVIGAYVRALERLRRELGLSAEVRADQVALLPGAMATEGFSGRTAGRIWRRVRPVAAAALARANRMRASEGRHTASALRKHCARMRGLLTRIAARAPGAAKAYRERLRRRVSDLLEGSGAAVDAAALARELVLHAERTDVSEELSRMKAHIAHFADALRDDGTGRKLEFIAQEMLREANTMCAKAGDAQMTEWSIDLRGEVDRVREQVLNLE